MFSTLRRAGSMSELEPSLESYASHPGGIMKRYEERLLEDMQSREWQILLTSCPPIYGLPNELLILIFGFVEGISTLRNLRRVSIRFNQLVTTLMFKTIYMDSIKPSRMALLPWALKGNPLLLCSSHSLHLRMCGAILTLHYPTRVPTTRDQDLAQAEVISSMPRLTTLSILLGQVTNIIYPHSVTTQSLGAMGFSRTLVALSQATSLRELRLRSSSDGGSSLLLLDLFTSVGERLEKLSLQRDVLIKILRLINRSGPSVDGYGFPILCNLVHLSLDLHYLTNQEFSEISFMLAHHLPRLATLECTYGENGDSWDGETVTLAMNPLHTLVIKGCISVRQWMVSIPTKAIELRFHESRVFRVMPRLADLIKSQTGVFRIGCVATVKVIIDASNIIPSIPLIYTLDALAAAMGAFTPEQALQLLKDACARSKIVLIAS